MNTAESKVSRRPSVVFDRLVEACKLKDVDRLSALTRHLPHSKSKDCVLNRTDRYQRTLFHYIAVITTAAASLSDTNSNNKNYDLSKEKQGDNKTTRKLSDDCANKSIECLSLLTAHSNCDAKKLWFAQDLDGLSVLHMAVISCNLPLVKHLLFEHPFSLGDMRPRLISMVDNEHHSPLHWAIMTQNSDCIKLLLSAPDGIELIHGRDLNGATPLHYATQASKYSRLRCRLNRMLSGNSITGERHEDANNNEDDPLTIGRIQAELNEDQRQQQVDLSINDAKSAARRGSDGAFNDETSYAGTINSTISADGHDDLEILRLFLAPELGGNRIQLDCIDNDRRTPLLWAASSGNWGAIKLLAEHGANLNASDSNELGPLHCAASHGYTRCLECLLKLGKLASTSVQQNNNNNSRIRVNQLDKLRCTPIFYAVLSGQIDCIEILLDHGASANWQDARGRTPAHFAALRGHLGALKLLAARKANLWLPNKQGDLPLHYAIKSGRQSVVHWLLDQSPYERAVNAINNLGRAPIHLAIARDKPELVRYLIAQGANLNQLVRVRGPKQQQYNHLAQVVDNEQQQSFYYETAYDLAKRLGRAKCLTLLIERRALPAAQVIRERSLRNQNASSIMAEASGNNSSGERQFAKSLFDLQPVVGGTSPIGLETSSSSASGCSPLNDTYIQQHHFSNSAPSPMMQNETNNDVSGFARDNQQRATTSGRHLSRSYSEPQSSGPIKGGISYNNDRINASIKCKLYEQMSSNSAGPQYQNQLSTNGRVVGKLGQQEIVTNVNVYTSPCPHCVQHQRCIDCAGNTGSMQNRSFYDATDVVQPKFSPWSPNGTATPTGGGSQMNEYDPSNNANDSQQERFDHAKSSTSNLQNRRRHLGNPNPSYNLPPLAIVNHSRPAPLMIGSGRTHLPPSQAHEQSLPTIMSASEQPEDENKQNRTNGDDDDNNNDDDATLTNSSISSSSSIHSLKEHNGVVSSNPIVTKSSSFEQANGVNPPTSGRLSRADEEPRFDRSDESRNFARKQSQNYRVRSPIGDYISNKPDRISISPVTSPQKQQISRTNATTNSYGSRLPNLQGVSRQSSRGNMNQMPSAMKPSDRHELVSLQIESDSQANARGVLGDGDDDNLRSVSRQTVTLRSTSTNEQPAVSEHLATEAEKSVRRYWQESKLFEELQNLKRNQIRSGRASEALLVKRLVERFHRETLGNQLIGLETYHGPYSFEAYETYLFNQLRHLRHEKLAFLSSQQSFLAQNQLSSYEGGDPEVEKSTEDRDTSGDAKAPADDGDDDEEARRIAEEEDLKAELELRQVLDKSDSVEQGGLKEKPIVTETMENNVEAIGDGDNDSNRSRGSSRQSSIIEVEQKKIGESSNDNLLPEYGMTRPESEAESEVAEDLSERVIDDALGNVVVCRKKGLNDNTQHERDSADVNDETLAEQQISETLTRQEESNHEPPVMDEIKQDDANEPAGEKAMQDINENRAMRRKSIVNIGKKLEIIYHSVGIEIEHADERLEDEQELKELEENKQRLQQDESDMQKQTGDDIRDGDSGIGSAKMNETDADKQAKSFEESMGESGMVDTEDAKQSNIDTDNQVRDVEQKGIAESIERRPAEKQQLDKARNQSSSFVRRIGSLPEQYQSSTSRNNLMKRGEGARRNRCISLDSSSDSAPSLAGRSKEARGSVVASSSRVYNGYDLDRMRARKDKQQQQQQTTGGEHQTKSMKSAELLENHNKSMKTLKKLRQNQDDHEHRHHILRPRSRLPSKPFIVELDAEKIQARWMAIKMDQKRRKKLQNNDSIGYENFVLIYEINNQYSYGRTKDNDHRQSRTSLGALTKSETKTKSTNDINSRRLEESREPDVVKEDGHTKKTLQTSQDGGRRKQVLLCQKKLIRIVDIRTLRRRMSLPESLLYSNQLSKKFNILKI